MLILAGWNSGTVYYSARLYMADAYPGVYSGHANLVAKGISNAAAGQPSSLLRNLHVSERGDQSAACAREVDS